MESRIKKSSTTDYPQLLFRLSQEDKDLIEEQIDELLKIKNADLSPRQIKFKKGEIATDALKRGLVELRAEVGQKKFSKKKKL